jgi:tetratricopeptide (TPR) repeat protein
MISLVSLVAFIVLTWFSLDMRSILRSGQRKNQLSIEGRWKDLEDHFKQISKPCRPFVWFHQKYLMPGNIAVQYALFLYKQGRLEESLAKVDQAIRQVEGKPGLFRDIFRSGTFTTQRGALKARILILTGLGRYDQARASAAQLEQLTGANGRPNASLALLEYYCGHLDEALAMAQDVRPEDSQYDAMRGVTALAYNAKGEFDQAIQALTYEPSRISKFYSREGMESMKEVPEGAKLIELQGKKLAGVFQPARLLQLAHVHVAHEKFEEAVKMLDQAEKTMGPELGIQTSYCRHRACSCAGLGNTVEAEKYIERMRALVQKTPKRSLLWETHFAAGQSYFYLGRFSDALAELNEAQRSVLHPIEKHFTAYWIARTNEAAGDRPAAVLHYQIVAADPIPSRMQKYAAEALARLKS